MTDKGGDYIMKTHVPNNINILNLHIQNNIISKYTKQRLTEFEIERNKCKINIIFSNINFQMTTH